MSNTKPNTKLNTKLTVLAAAFASAGLTALPAFSQAASTATLEPAPTATRLLASPSTHSASPQRLAQASDAEAEARKLIEKLGPLQSNGEAFYTTFSTSAVEGFQSQISRPLTDLERQQLYDFWYQKVQASLFSSELQEMLVAAYVQKFTLEELTAINQFYETPAGLKWQTMLPDLQQTLGTMSSEYLLALAADDAWISGTLNDLLSEIPSLTDSQ